MTATQRPAPDLTKGTLRLVDATRRYGVGRTKLRELAAAGTIGFTRVGRSILLSTADIERILTANAGQVRERPPAKGQRLLAEVTKHTSEQHQS